jgi:hypothetical protein
MLRSATTKSVSARNIESLFFYGDGAVTFICIVSMLGYRKAERRHFLEYERRETEAEAGFASSLGSPLYERRRRRND